MDRALEIAREQACRSRMMFRIGCVLVKNNQIIGAGRNRNFSTKTSVPKSHFDLLKTPEGIFYPFSIHAEMDALKKFIPAWRRREVKDADIFIFGLDLRNKPIEAWPCKTCRRLLRQMKIKKIYIYNGKNIRVKDFQTTNSFV